MAGKYTYDARLMELMTEPIKYAKLIRKDICLTEMTIAALEQILKAEKKKNPKAKLTPILERLLREHPEMEAARQKSKREWDTRPPNGFPPRLRKRKRE